MERSIIELATKTLFDASERGPLSIGAAVIGQQEQTAIIPRGAATADLGR